jgi:uncharacterized membrane protein
MKLIKRFPQIVLGLLLVFTGVAHLTSRRLEFQSQVPNQLKEVANFVVLASGFVEILLGVGLIVLWRLRVSIGWATAIYFIAVFWGNISQLLNGTDAFGLNTREQRFARLLFQPVLVMWALLSTGAWGSWRRSYSEELKADENVSILDPVLSIQNP